MDKLLLNSLISKMEFLEAHNKNYNKTQYNCICNVLEILKNERIQILKKNYLKYKKLSLSKINFEVFDKFEKPLNEKDFKNLRLKALKKFLWYTGNHKEIFYNNVCFISSSCLHGFYFPNYESVYCIAFINGKAILILNDTE